MHIFNFDEQLIPLDVWIQTAVDWLVLNYRDFFQMLKVPIELCLNGLEWIFTSLPPVVVISCLLLPPGDMPGKGSLFLQCYRFY